MIIKTEAEEKEEESPVLWILLAIIIVIIMILLLILIRKRNMGQKSVGNINEGQSAIEEGQKNKEST